MPAHPTIADDDEHDRQRRLNRGGHGDEQEKRREGERDVGQPHHQGVDPPAVVPRQEPQEHAEGDRDRLGDEPHRERQPRAVEHPAQHVPALGIGSEEKPAPGIHQVGVPQIALERVERGAARAPARPPAPPGPPGPGRAERTGRAAGALAAPQESSSSRDVGYPARWRPRTPLHRLDHTAGGARFLQILPGEGYAGHLNPGKRVIPDRPFTLVLSGGGLKGLAHIGVLRALEERGLVPSLVVGSSIGSLIGAAWAAGATPTTDGGAGAAGAAAGRVPGRPRRRRLPAAAGPRALPPGTARDADLEPRRRRSPSATSSAACSSTPTDLHPACR